MPLGKTFFSPSFGAVADKFGVGWLVYVGAERRSQRGIMQELDACGL